MASKLLQRPLKQNQLRRFWMPTQLHFRKPKKVLCHACMVCGQGAWHSELVLPGSVVCAGMRRGQILWSAEKWWAPTPQTLCVQISEPVLPGSIVCAQRAQPACIGSPGVRSKGVLPSGHRIRKRWQFCSSFMSIFWACIWFMALRLR